MITAGYPRQMVHEYQLFYTQNISLSTKTLKTEKSIITFQHKGMLSFPFYIQMKLTIWYCLVGDPSKIVFVVPLICQKKL